MITNAARVRHPKDKPHVESGVQYVRDHIFKGNDVASLRICGMKAVRWCRDFAGQRVHGTTWSLPPRVFQDEEPHALAPWNGEPSEVIARRTAKVRPDPYVACQYALTPCRQPCSLYPDQLFRQLP